MPARGDTTMIAAALSVLAVPGVPLAVIACVFAAHVASYDGTCGPYPPDIPAFACGWSDYLAGFAEPFAIAGMLALSVLLAIATLAGLAGLWTAYAIVAAVRARLRPEGRSVARAW